MPDAGVIAGNCDYREGVDAFHGRVDCCGKQVLVVGRANGFFSFEMEKRDAIVIAIDLGQHVLWDIVSHPFADEDDLISNMRSNAGKVDNAFRYGRLGRRRVLWNQARL